MRLHRCRKGLMWLCRVPSRGMVNEEEVLGFIAANFDVNVTRIMFGGRMEEAMSVMQQTDMLIGLHGAGTCLQTLNPKP